MLHDVEIDWGWPQLNAVQRALVRHHEALLQADRRSHTVESIEQALVEAARDLPGRLIRVRAVDDDRHYRWQVVDGEVYPGEDFDPTGMYPGDLTADDFRAAGVTQVMTPIVFPDSMLLEIKRRGNASLASLIQGAWKVAGDALPAGFRTPSGPRHVQAIYLPIEVWAAIQERAKLEQRSVSYLVQRAVTAAYELAVY